MTAVSRVRGLLKRRQEALWPVIDPRIVLDVRPEVVARLVEGAANEHDGHETLAGREAWVIGPAVLAESCPVLASDAGSDGLQAASNAVSMMGNNLEGPRVFIIVDS